MVELVDAADSKSVSSNGVGVRVPPWAPNLGDGIMSTADCIELLKSEDLTPFSNLLTNNKIEWKRVNKFKYKNGIRRYFVLLNSCIIATVDEIGGQLNAVVRPPMLWELYMIQNLRPNDSFLQDDVLELYYEHNDFIVKQSSKYSEPEQYSFSIGDEDGGWIFFSPKMCSDYDQHLSSDLYYILPSSIRDNEECECMYSFFNVSSKEQVKKDLIDLGFEYDKNLV